MKMELNIYKKWNFWDNPFITKPLEANYEGRSLLVGRTREIKLIRRKLFNPPLAVTIEGLNGVGKTSLVNAAIYDSYQDFLNDLLSTLYIPCISPFQLAPDKSTEDFLDEIYLVLGQTLIKKSEEIKNIGRKVPQNSYSIDKWLNSPNLNSFYLSIKGIDEGSSSSLNSTDGFKKSGLRLHIRDWLKEMFPTSDEGGIVCVIDNLELLETSDKARRVMESLRDELFNIPGTRWIFCGSMGIVNCLAATPRMHGYLYSPIEIKGIDKIFIGDLFAKRIKYYTKTPKKSYIPLNSNLFEFIYEVLNENLRDTLSICNEYCLYIVDSGRFPKTDKKRDTEFKLWFENLTQNMKCTLDNQLRPRAVNLFNDIVKFGGIFSPSNFEELNFKSMTAMRPHIKELENVGLIISTIDESDNRRKTIEVTSKGWLVSYSIKNKFISMRD